MTEVLAEKKRDGVPARRTAWGFEYWVTLPQQVEPEDVDASLSDGILKVRVPKSEPAQRRKIELKAS
jgi:HSP20 family protein